jgi:hypothetical protein
VKGAFLTSIFISYARKDGRELAANLHQQLETDYDIWQDVVDMPGGENWWEAIRRAIESVDVMILVVTDRALEPSSVVRREWMHARKVGTPILPIAFDADIFSKAPGWLKKRDVFILAPDHPDYDATWVRLRAQLDNPPDRRPVPFMPLPLLQTFTARYAKQDEIKSHILDEYAVNPRFLSVALQGEGGFGKTTLAQAICHDIDVFEAFDGGVLWAEIGENVTNLTEKINAMIRSLTGVQVAYSDEAEAARRLHNELQDRECLLVLDDIWDAAQLQPFLGAITSAYIITTQDDAIASTADEIVIANQMEPREALQVFVNWVPERQRPSVTDDPEQAALSDLAYRLGEWPLLLGIIGFELSAEIERTQSLLNAITFINEGLNEAGLTTFDRNSARDRHAALHATMNYSLRRFGDDEKCRLFELAVFPENVLVPEAVALRLWAETADMRGFKSRNLLRDLNGRFFQMRAQEKGGALFLRFHRTVRLYLAERLGDDWPAECVKGLQQLQ